MLLQLPPNTSFASFGAATAFCCALFSSTMFATAPAVSPVPERLAAREAWRYAESFVSGKPDCDVVVGRGGSMLPLYPDGTVLVLQRLPLAELRPGMTVVFVGDSGRPVAHALVKKTWRGWVAKGLNNDEADQTLVRTQNYLGAVVRAFTPVVAGTERGENVAEE